MPQTHSSGPFAADVYEMMAILLDAELVDIRWGSQAMLCGFTLSATPRIARVEVPDERQAWAINLAKEALGKDDIDRAYQELQSITGPVMATAAAAR